MVPWTDPPGRPGRGWTGTRTCSARTTWSSLEEDLDARVARTEAAMGPLELVGKGPTGAGGPGGALAEPREPQRGAAGDAHHPMSWSCPDCARTFAQRPTLHSCVPSDVQAALREVQPLLLPVVLKLMELVDDWPGVRWEFASGSFCSWVPTTFLRVRPRSRDAGHLHAGSRGGRVP